MECPICFEKINKKNEVVLACNHKYCKKCLKYLQDNSAKYGCFVNFLKVGKPFYLNENKARMLLSNNPDKNIKCPMCRKEYTICCDEYIFTLNKKSKPLPIMGKVWFRKPDTNELSICHNITNESDALHYIPLRDEIEFKIRGNPSEYSKILLSLFKEEMFENKKEFHSVLMSGKAKTMPEVLLFPADKCPCIAHATPDDLLRSLIEFNPKKNQTINEEMEVLKINN